MGKQFLAVLVATAALATACHGNGDAKVGDASPIRVRSVQDAHAAVRDARVVRPMAFDGDALRVDVANGRPSFDEAAAIARYRAGEAGELVGAVTVAYGTATLGVPVVSAGRVVRPLTPPAFRQRAAWVIVWSPGGHSCPMVTGTLSKAPAPVDVELLAADGSGEGVDFQTRGSDCSEPATGPSATVAAYELSLPWREGPAAASAPVLRVVGAIPACGVVEGTAGGGETSHPFVQVKAFVLLARPPCTRTSQSSTVPSPYAAGTPLQHAPTGPIATRQTDSNVLTYFDGRTRTVRDPSGTTAG